jgi:F0F1-type ATP synthase delta subunit
MARIKVVDYEQTLAALLREAGADERQGVFVNFLRLLQRQGDFKKLNLILDLYAQRLNQAAGKLSALVYYFREPPTLALQTRIKKFLIQRFNCRAVDLSLVPMPTNIGVMVEAAGSRFDLTLKRQVESFKRTLLAS